MTHSIALKGHPARKSRYRWFTAALVSAWIFGLSFEAAKASTFAVSGNYDLNAGNATFSGFLEVDATAGLITSANITIDFAIPATFTTILSQGATATGWSFIVADNTANLNSLFNFDTTPTPGSLVGFTGSDFLSTILSFCSGATCTPFSIGAGIITSEDAVSATPLPAALPLFATIFAGRGLVAWRKRRTKLA